MRNNLITKPDCIIVIVTYLIHSRKESFISVFAVLPFRGVTINFFMFLNKESIAWFIHDNYNVCLRKWSLLLLLQSFMQCISCFCSFSSFRHVCVIKLKYTVVSSTKLKMWNIFYQKSGPNTYKASSEMKITNYVDIHVLEQ